MLEEREKLIADNFLFASIVMIALSVILVLSVVYLISENGPIFLWVSFALCAIETFFDGVWGVIVSIIGR